MTYNTDIERLNYYEGEYLGAVDFQAEQEYHREMRRRHNLGQHTWGIVSGLQLAQPVNRATTGGNTNVDVYLQPGMAVDGFGREIVVLSQIALTQEMFAAFYSSNSNSKPQWMYIWIAYREALLQSSTDVCANANTSNAYGRIGESYMLAATTNQTSPVDSAIVVDGNTMQQPTEASITAGLDATLTDPPQIVVPLDDSLPFQEFSTDDTSLVWWVPLGRVMWDPYNEVFVQIATDPAQAALAAGVNRDYAGNVSACTYAPAGMYSIVDRNSPVPPLAGSDPNLGGVQVNVAGSLNVEFLFNAEMNALIGGPYDANNAVSLSPLTIYANGANEDLIQFRNPSGQATWDICENPGGSNPGIDISQIGSSGTLPGTSVLFIQSGGNVGVGTTSPQQNLSVNVGLNIDQEDTNPGGPLPTTGATKALIFGSNSGEAIGSCRTGSANLHGLDFYTGYAVQMSIANPNSGGTVSTTNSLTVGATVATPSSTDGGSGSLTVNGNRTYLMGVDGASNHWIMAGGTTEWSNNAICLNATDKAAFIGSGISPSGVNNAWNLTVTGDLIVTGTVNGTKVGYVADRFINRDGAKLERGDVVVLHAAPSSQYYGSGARVPLVEVQIAENAFDTRVCGIVDEPTLAPAKIRDLDRKKIGDVAVGLMVTLGAYSSCKVDADIAPISPGDLLTTSSIPGYAQKVDPAAPPRPGAVIGKALGALANGKGLIPVFVTHQ